MDISFYTEYSSTIKMQIANSLLNMAQGARLERSLKAEGIFSSCACARSAVSAPGVPAGSRKTNNSTCGIVVYHQSQVGATLIVLHKRAGTHSTPNPTHRGPA